MQQTGPTSTSKDAVVERLNDPAVAASLVTLLDNAELISTLVLGLSSLMERGEFIMDSVSESVRELKTAGAIDGAESMPSIQELGSMASQLSAATPVLSHLLESSIAQPATVDFLAFLSDAAAEGMQEARTNKTTVEGVRGAMKALKDPDTQRGLGVMLEIARALGKKIT